MNVSELARRLRVSPNDLYDALPQMGVDVGRRAVKIDDRTAFGVIERFPAFWREVQKKRADEAKRKRELEVEVRVAEQKSVVLPPVLTVRDFAARLALPIPTVIAELLKNGILAAMNERIDFSTASIIAEDLGFKVVEEKEKPIEELVATMQAKEIVEEGDAAKLAPRPPVVVVMGHVDHGKTRTLDAIRKTDVMSTEAGGITQHIGAYQTKTKGGRLITFIDTPGHEAFTTMRSRGARVADIAILVVAADDGVQPQTIEALKIANAAKVPIVVAVNKMDKPEADPEKVKRQLGEQNVIPEEWGGKTPFVPISAKAGTGIDKLLEVALLVADIEGDKIKANPDRAAVGTVIEAHVDKGEGPVATVLVQAGTLHAKDPLVVNGKIYGRVRAMKDHHGTLVKEAVPGMPVRILGFEVAPEVGDILDVASVGTAERVKKYARAAGFAGTPVASKKKDEEETRGEEEEEKKKIYPVVLKCDVLGSLEAIIASLEKYAHPEVAVKVASRGLGNVTDADVQSAEAAHAVIYAFHVVPTPQAAEFAREKGVEMRQFKIIYDLLSDVRKTLETMLPPEVIVTELGKAKVLALFRGDAKSQVVGAVVVDGKILPESRVRVRRGEVVAAEGQVVQLRSGKSVLKEAHGGQEFGVEYKGEPVIGVGDVLEAYREEKKVRKLVF